MDIREFDKRVIALKNPLYRLARGMLGCAAEAEDAVQDVLEKFWIRRDKLEGNVEGMVFVAMRNHCVDRLRGRKTKGNMPDMGAEMGVETRDLMGIVEKVMAKLPERQQLIMQLRDIEGLDYRRIAAIVGLEEGAVRALLSRARKQVREKVTKIMEYGL